MSISLNYIEFNDNNARIHKNGKVLTLRNQICIDELKKICRKNKAMLNGKSELKNNPNINTIIEEFEKYYFKYLVIKTGKKRLKVLGEILTNMVINKENKTINKKIAAASLATIIGLTSIGIINSNKKEVSIETPIEEEIVIDDLYEEELNTYYIQPTIQEQYIVNDNTAELQSMIQLDEFHFSYEDRTSYENLSNARRYEDLFEKYGNMYGVDKNLLMAMSAQENCGKHYEQLNGTYATGIMQIERSANLNSTVSAYNFETGQTDSIYITQDKIEDLEQNIQIGTMILRNRLEENNFNIPLSLQSYNFGYGNMATVISICCERENLTRDELRANTTNPEWLNYRTTINVGDPQYVEHVFSFIPSDTVLTLRVRDGEDVTLKIVNDNVINYQMT